MATGLYRTWKGRVVHSHNAFHLKTSPEYCWNCPEITPSPHTRGRRTVAQNQTQYVATNTCFLAILITKTHTHTTHNDASSFIVELCNKHVRFQRTCRHLVLATRPSFVREPLLLMRRNRPLAELFGRHAPHATTPTSHTCSEPPAWHSTNLSNYTANDAYTRTWRTHPDHTTHAHWHTHHEHINGVVYSNKYAALVMNT